MIVAWGGGGVANFMRGGEGRGCYVCGCEFCAIDVTV